MCIILAINQLDMKHTSIYHYFKLLSVFLEKSGTKIIKMVKCWTMLTFWKYVVSVTFYKVISGTFYKDLEFVFEVYYSL